jgi:hypothetical protein
MTENAPTPHREDTHAPGWYARFVRWYMKRSRGVFPTVGAVLQWLGTLRHPDGRQGRALLAQGFFWLPCPVCGAWRSGAAPAAFTSDRRGTIQTGPGRHTMICGLCAEDGVGDRAHKAYMDSLLVDAKTPFPLGEA